MAFLRVCNRHHPTRHSVSSKETIKAVQSYANDLVHHFGNDKLESIVRFFVFFPSCHINHEPSFSVSPNLVDESTEKKLKNYASFDYIKSKLQGAAGHLLFGY